MKGMAWINAGEDVENYWAEAIKCDVTVEATDDDEIKVGFQLTGESHEDAFVYLSRAEADRLARFLSAAVVTEVRIPA